MVQKDPFLCIRKTAHNKFSGLISRNYTNLAMGTFHKKWSRFLLEMDMYQIVTNKECLEYFDFLYGHRWSKSLSDKENKFT